MTVNPATSLSLNGHSFLPGDRIVGSLVVPSDVPLDRAINISLSFFRIETFRDQFAFGFGAAPTVVAGALVVEQNLPTDFQPGLYGIGEATISVQSDSAQRHDIHVTFPPVFFQVRTAIEQPAAIQTIIQKISLLSNERLRLANKPHIVSPASDPSGQRFSIWVFGVGCLLHQAQQLEGYVIRPMGQGFSHKNMRETVNSFFLQAHGYEPVPFIDTTEQAFAGATPIFVIFYPVVIANSADAALDYCSHHAQRVFTILAIDRGQKPRGFAYIATQHDTNNWWHRFAFPGYRGNLLADFNPAKTANEIERLLPRLETNPFLRLIVTTYSDATAEEEYGFALLRFWSILELVAERKIAPNLRLKHPDGTAILNAKGNPEMSGSKHGRVYEYIRSNGGYEESGTYEENGNQKSYHIGSATNPNVGPGTEVITLWEMVRATYSIRNAIAHEGQFDPAKAGGGDSHQQLAARLAKRVVPNPLR